jgi:adenine phosphoribosyltransferase
MLEAVREAIRDVPDFPQPGILFKDITPVLQSPVLYREVVAALVERVRTLKVDKVAVVESRGFLFGAPVAYELGLGLVPIRKKGKLPYRTIEQSYALEYGTATLEIHEDAFRTGDRVVIIDDLLATGGTAVAAAQLVEKVGGVVTELQFLVELTFLNGRERLARYPVFAPIAFG